MGKEIRVTKETKHNSQKGSQSAIRIQCRNRWNIFMNLSNYFALNSLSQFFILYFPLSQVEKFLKHMKTGQFLGNDLCSWRCIRARNFFGCATFYVRSRLLKESCYPEETKQLIIVSVGANIVRKKIFFEDSECLRQILEIKF